MGASKIDIQLHDFRPNTTHALLPAAPLSGHKEGKERESGKELCGVKWVLRTILRNLEEVDRQDLYAALLEGALLCRSWDLSRLRIDGGDIVYACSLFLVRRVGRSAMLCSMGLLVRVLVV